MKYEINSAICGSPTPFNDDVALTTKRLPHKPFKILPRHFPHCLYISHTG